MRVIYKDAGIYFSNRYHYIHDDGTTYYYLGGKLHRVGGPAVRYKDGSEFCYLFGIHLTPREYSEWMSKNAADL